MAENENLPPEFERFRARWNGMSDEERDEYGGKFELFAANKAADQGLIFYPADDRALGEPIADGGK